MAERMFRLSHLMNKWTYMSEHVIVHLSAFLLFWSRHFLNEQVVVYTKERLKLFFLLIRLSCKWTVLGVGPEQDSLFQTTMVGSCLSTECIMNSVLLFGVATEHSRARLPMRPSIHQIPAQPIVAFVFPSLFMGSITTNNTIHCSHFTWWGLLSYKFIWCRLIWGVGTVKNNRFGWTH